jgi:hypothetical protein
MSALEKIKNEVAKEHDFDAWKDVGVHPSFDLWREDYWEGVSERYASESVKEYKEKLKLKLNNLTKTTHGRVFATEVIELVESLDKQ